MDSLPHARKDLRRHRVEDQVLVYDARTDRTHLLDMATGTVLELLEDGTRTPEALVTELGRRLARPADDALVTLAIDELRKAELLEEEKPSAPLNEVSRRQLLRRAGLVGAAALLVPTVVSLTANPVYAQTATQCAVAKKPVGCVCSTDTDCASNNCNNGTKKCKA